MNRHKNHAYPVWSAVYLQDVTANWQLNLVVEGHCIRFVETETGQMAAVEWNTAAVEQNTAAVGPKTAQKTGCGTKYCCC